MGHIDCGDIPEGMSYPRADVKDILKALAKSTHSMHVAKITIPGY